jgi:hypothetical protein
VKTVIWRPRRRLKNHQPIIEHCARFLCHRGADPLVIAEIVGALEASSQTVTIQAHDGLSISLADFRAFVSRQIDNGHTSFIVLLNEHLPGPVYRQTFSPIRKRASFYLVRVDDCDLEGVDFVSVDLSNREHADERRAAIVRICPTDASRCCGTNALAGPAVADARL